LDPEPFVAKGNIIEVPKNNVIFGTLRKGRWSKEEERYTQALIDTFNSSMAPIGEKWKLALFVSRLLQCPLGRLASKLKTGKKAYNSKNCSSVSQVEITQYIGLQKFLSEYEEAFLSKLANSSELDDAATLSFHTQYFWTQSFIQSLSGQLYPLVAPLNAPKLSMLPQQVMQSFRHMYRTLCSHSVRCGQALNAQVLENDRLKVLNDLLNDELNPPPALAFVAARDSQELLISCPNVRNLMKRFPELGATQQKNINDIFSVLFFEPSPIVAALTVQNVSGEFMNEDVTSLMFDSEGERQRLTGAGYFRANFRSLARVFLCEDIDQAGCMILNCFVDNVVISYVHTHRYSVSHGREGPVAAIDRERGCALQGYVGHTNAGMGPNFEMNDFMGSSQNANYWDAPADYNGAPSMMPVKDPSQRLNDLVYSDMQPQAVDNANMGPMPTSGMERNYYDNCGEYGTVQKYFEPGPGSMPVDQGLFSETQDYHGVSADTKDPIAAAAGSLKRKRDALELQAAYATVMATAMFREAGEEAGRSAQDGMKKVLNAGLQGLAQAEAKSCSDASVVSSNRDSADGASSVNSNEIALKGRSAMPAPGSIEQGAKKPYSAAFMPLHSAVGNFFLQASTTKYTPSSNISTPLESTDLASTVDSPLSSDGNLSPHLAKLFTDFSDVPQWNVSTHPTLASLHFESHASTMDSVLCALSGSGTSERTKSLHKLFEREHEREMESSDDNSQSTTDTPILLSSFSKSTPKPDPLDTSLLKYAAGSNEKEEKDIANCESGAEVALTYPSRFAKRSAQEDVARNRLGYPLYNTLKSLNHRDSDKDIFNKMLVSFLRRIPFDVIELWVPVKISTTTTVLLFGGSASSDENLRGWSSYSRNFVFSQNEGIPGRVNSKKITECRDDVASTDMAVFKRAEGAATYGIHASVAMPLGLNDRDPVIVLYSKKIFQPTDALVEYMKVQLQSLNLKAHIQID
jgi:hypothetical protein